MDQPLIERRLRRGGAWTVVGRFTNIGFAVVNVSLLARILAKDDFGVFLLAASIAKFIALFGHLGMDQTMIRLIAESLGLGEESRIRNIVQRAYGIAGITAVALSAILLSGLGVWITNFFFSSANLNRTVVAWVLWGIGLTLQKLISDTFRGFHDIARATLFGGMLSTLLIFSCLVGFLLFNEQTRLDTVLYATVGCLGINMLVSGLELIRILRTVTGGPEKHPVPTGTIIRYSLPLMVAAVAAFLRGNLDLWIVAAYRPEPDVALYGSIARLHPLVLIPLTIVNLVIAPMLAELWARKEVDQMQRVTRSMAALASIFSGSLLLLFVVAGGPILDLLFGESYSEGYLILVVLCAGRMFSVLAGSCGNTLMMTGYAKDLLRIVGLSVVVSLAVMLMVVKEYGLLGVALANAGTIVVTAIGEVAMVRFRCGVWTFASPSRLPEALRLFRWRKKRNET